MIRTKDGKEFVLGDYDVIVKDLNVSSIMLDPVSGKVEGSDGQIDYGAVGETRTIKVPITIKANDLLDFPLLRDLIFSLVSNKESFYIREMRRPKMLSYEFVDTNEAAKDSVGSENVVVTGKQYKVRISNQFDFEQLNIYGDTELIFETTELPFAESIGMTQDMRVEDNLFPLSPSGWEQGAINQTGGNISRSTSVRTKDYIEVTSGRYNFTLERGKELFVREFNSNKVFVETEGPTNLTGNRQNLTVELSSTTKYIKVYFNSNNSIRPKDVGVDLIAKITEDTEHNFKLSSADNLWGYGMGLKDDEELQYTHFVKSGETFDIYNAGNVAVHPFEQELFISINNIRGSTEYFSLVNQTNGTEFRTTEAVGNANQLEIGRGTIKNNGLHYLRETTKEFIELSPGNNRFKISGASSATISFNFRFYYH